MSERIILNMDLATAGEIGLFEFLRSKGFEHAQIATPAPAEALRASIQAIHDQLAAMEATANRKTKVGRAAEAVVHSVRIRLAEILAAAPAPQTPATRKLEDTGQPYDAEQVIVAGQSDVALAHSAFKDMGVQVQTPAISSAAPSVTETRIDAVGRPAEETPASARPDVLTVEDLKSCVYVDSLDHGLHWEVTVKRLNELLALCEAANDPH